MQRRSRGKHAFCPVCVAAYNSEAFRTHCGTLRILHEYAPQTQRTWQHVSSSESTAAGVKLATQCLRSCACELLSRGSRTSGSNTCTGGGVHEAVCGTRAQSQLGHGRAQACIMYLLATESEHATLCHTPQAPLPRRANIRGLQSESLREACTQGAPLPRMQAGRLRHTRQLP